MKSSVRTNDIQCGQTKKICPFYLNYGPKCLVQTQRVFYSLSLAFYKSLVLCDGNKMINFKQVYIFLVSIEIPKCIQCYRHCPGGKLLHQSSLPMHSAVHFIGHPKGKYPVQDTTNLDLKSGSTFRANCKPLALLLKIPTH